jgi:glycosyltransferase involved in cell wall biosynthesis
VSARPRVLMLGTVNHPHVEHLALGMSDRGFAVAVGGAVEPTLPGSALSGAGIEILPAPTVRRSTASGVARHVRWVRRILHGYRPALVHAHWLPGFAFAAAAAGSSPLVVTAWGSDALRANRRQAIANRIAVRAADLVTADSEALLARTIELGADPRRTMLFNWGVDTARFAPAADRTAVRRRLGLGPSPMILSPRSLLPVYNIPTILEAFDAVGRAVPDAQLVLKHMGADTAELGPLPHPERVRLVAHVPYAAMADYYGAADVCVSIPSSDSSPRSAWEALACGCPLVVSDLPWVHELIEPDRHAVVVPIEAAAVAGAIERVLVEPELAGRLARNGRELVLRHRDRDVELDRLAAQYERLIGRSRS